MSQAPLHVAPEQHHHPGLSILLLVSCWHTDCHPVATEGMYSSESRGSVRLPRGREIAHISQKKDEPGTAPPPEASSPAGIPPAPLWAFSQKPSSHSHETNVPYQRCFPHICPPLYLLWSSVSRAGVTLLRPPTASPVTPYCTLASGSRELSLRSPQGVNSVSSRCPGRGGLKKVGGSLCPL